MRIVSLLPSVTEILFALGAGENVVGVTFECDYPPEAQSRRIVSFSTLPEGLDAAGIDAAVTERKAAGDDLYRLDDNALADLDADLIITQDLCAVCAVETASVEAALEHLGTSARVLTVDPADLAGVLGSISTIGQAIGRTAEAETLVGSLRQRLATLREHLATARAVPTLVLEWTDPPFAPGHWVPDMIAEAGGASVLGTTGDPSFRTGWPEVAAAGPELVISAPCGFDLAESVRHTEKLTDRGELAGVPLWAADANAAFARPGPRLVDGIEALARALHPELGEPDPALLRRVTR